jgi:tRNA threonylcarbamoyladenosine biosynthesis protein TsaB
MKILAVDTSTMAGSVALFDGSSLLGEVNISSHITHSRRLLNAIDIILKGTALELKDIDYYAIAIGPGSFTGLRIGLGTIKGLAMATQRKVCPIVTLEAMAYKVAAYCSVIYPMLDAGREQIYTVIYRRKKGKLVKETNEMVLEPAQFLASLKEYKAAFYGNGAKLYKTLIERITKGEALFPEEDFYLARPIALLALEKIKSGRLVESSFLTPFYIRPSDAEIKKASIINKEREE